MNTKINILCKKQMCVHHKDSDTLYLICRKDDVLDEFIKGIRLYFNKTLGSLLLYRNEYDQYTELCANKEPSSIYGAEHLLRLFGKYIICL